MIEKNAMFNHHHPYEMVQIQASISHSHFSYVYFANRWPIFHFPSMFALDIHLNSLTNVYNLNLSDSISRCVSGRAVELIIPLQFITKLTLHFFLRSESDSSLICFAVQRR
ncbi:hypothetical protein NH340_JMT09317 [Sarcoptes scabiei]|nr:hypothetical protein NH340_JMT09317 [Sarcoptes scabiei]